VARRLLVAAGLPIAAPSANPSGRVSATTPQHVLAGLGGRIPLIVAGGRSAVGVESTILDLSGEQPVLLRPGGATIETLTALIGPIALGHGNATRPKAPGQLESHYAPRAPVRLNAREPSADEALLTFGPDLRKGPRVLNLSEAGDLDEAAANLFAMLHALDRMGAVAIAVSPIPEVGLGAAINDRLRRAAAPRA
jgi:L-threonylcarbamoyladenylate synthase